MAYKLSLFFIYIHIIIRKDNDMKENFEIEKELKFNSNLSEILSISLEEKHEVNDKKLEGNFIVSGEYKIHEISLNKEKFSFKIPFQYDLKSDIEIDSINVDITNFIYDTVDDCLYVTIAYDIVADRKDILLFDDEEDLDEFLKTREVELIMDDVEKEINSVLEKDEEIKVIKDLDEIIKENEIESETCESNLDIEDSRNMDLAKENLLNSVKVEDDTYVTYQIHIVKESDSLESILVKYNMSLDELKEYNDFNTLNLGMKLIIPIVHEK